MFGNLGSVATSAAGGELQKLLAILIDPKSTQARLDELAKAEADLAASVEKARSERSAADAALQTRIDAVQAAEASLAKGRADFDAAAKLRASDLDKREDVVRQREAAVADREAAVSAGEDDLAARIKQLRALVKS